MPKYALRYDPEEIVTEPDMTDASSGGRGVRYRGRHLPMVAVVVAATIATALAYSGMVLFGLEVAGMSPAEAYALAGFLEVSLVAVALMARNAALEGRPYGVLLSLTWLLSGTSGVFAALHEIAVPNASTPYMVAFRFVPPLVAALMWHLALVGERHMVTGNTLEQRRREHRVHQYVTALELWRDARNDSTGTSRDLRKVRAAHRRQRLARDGALKLLTVEDFERRMEVWVERLEAAERHGTRLDTIGASSVKRGVARGTTAATELAEPAAAEPPTAGTRPALVPFGEVFEAALAETPARRGASEQAPAEHAPAGQVAAEHGSTERFETERFETEQPGEVPAYDAGPAWEVRAPGEAALAFEPLPETGHTRRVELFDRLGRADFTEQTEQTEQIEAPARGTDTGASSSATVEQPASERDRRIVELSGQGLSQREIADQVSASRATVSRVLRRYGATAQAAGADLELEPA